MSLRICVCCGETMAEGSNRLSRNPNICASCSSLADGGDDDDLSRFHGIVPTESTPLASNPLTSTLARDADAPADADPDAHARRAWAPFRPGSRPRPE